MTTHDYLIGLYWRNHKMELFFRLSIWALATACAIHYGGWLVGAIAFFVTPFILRKF